MKYLFFYVEVEYEQYQKEEPYKIFYNFYNDGSYEKAYVYKEEDDDAHSFQSGTLLMHKLLSLQSFVKHQFPSCYCCLDGFDKTYTFISFDQKGHILHETSGYATKALQNIIDLLP